MRIRLADYLADTLVSYGITQNFMITGGGAMHLNDALGHKAGMHTLYQHHEQALAMAAESYARIYNRPALVTVTSGPGGTNAITGVLGAWLDSIPMIIFSGQVRFDTTMRWSGREIRAMGDQEFDITKSIACMTKYSEMLIDPYRVKYAVEKCIYLSQSGRPGPCWLDIPLNIQGFYVESDDLIGFDPEDYQRGGDGWEKPSFYFTNNIESCKGEDLDFYKGLHYETAAELQFYEADEITREKLRSKYKGMDNPHILPEDKEPELKLNPRRELPAERDKDVLKKYAKEILCRVKNSLRPVFYTGNGIRIAGAEKLFLEVAKLLNIPVVVGWNAPDVIPSDHPLFAGHPGGRGDRPGNLAVQNADLILSIGSRLNVRQIGYDFDSWAREAFVIYNDIDYEELMKPSVSADLRIHADAYELLSVIKACLEDELKAEGLKTLFSGGEGLLFSDASSIVHTEKASQVLKDHLKTSEDGLSSELHTETAGDRLSSELHTEAVGDRLSSKSHTETAEDSKDRLSWLETIAFYRENYPVVIQDYLKDSKNSEDYANVYAVVKVLSELLSEEQVTVVGNGSPCVAGSQAYVIKNGSRFISQDGVASMGYDLPAAIGASAAVHGSDSEDTFEKGKRNPYWSGAHEKYPDYKSHDIILLTGDGSIQMNIQELQTIIHHRMPIKIFYINNGGYHSIRQTQHSFFKGPLVGIGVDSGVGGVQDLSFPDMGKIADAYGYPYTKVCYNEDLEAAFKKTLGIKGPAICEIKVSMDQEFLPKSAARRLPDGSLVSPPLEDMSPFLSEEELSRLMLIKPLRH